MNTFRCRVCGYIYKTKGDAYEVCPVCGTAGSPFTPYNPEMSNSRFSILKNPPHQLMVHFPAAVPGAAIIIALLSFVGAVSSADASNAIKILAFILPFLVVSAGVFGLFDARTRVMRLNTPYLRIKILTASVFLILSAFYALNVYKTQLSNEAFIVQSVLVNIIFTAIAGILGHYGGKFICTYIRKPE